MLLLALSVSLPATVFAAAGQATSYPCLIEPAETVELSTPVAGVLQKVTVKRGDRVRRGQLLAALDSRAEQAGAQLALYKSQLKGPVEEAQAKIKFAQRKFERLQAMTAEHLEAAQKQDDAEAALREGQAELIVARENLESAHLDYQRQLREIEQRSIYSPFDGVVVSQSVWPGDVVQPSDAKRPVLTLAKIDPLNVRVILPMDAFGVPRVGMSATVKPEIGGDAILTAKVTSVDRIIDAASGSFEVFLDLPNTGFNIPSGIKCSATFASPDAKIVKPASSAAKRAKAVNRSSPT